MGTPKSLLSTSKPWAQPVNVIGYTAGKPIDANGLTKWQNAATIQVTGQPGKRFLKHNEIYRQCRVEFPKGQSSLPSVYYTSGHATLQHKDADNIGWEGVNRRWFFFENVDPYDWGHFSGKDESQHVKDIKIDLKAIPKSTQPNDPRSLFDKYCATKKLSPDSGWQRLAAAVDWDNTVRLILAFKLGKKYGTYGRLPHVMAQVPAGVQSQSPQARLMEIYALGNDVRMHPSRHRFYPVFGKGAQTVLHCLAVSEAMWRSRGIDPPSNLPSKTEFTP